jgi:hypothetical protein
MHHLILASAKHHSSVLTIVIGVIVLILTRGAWFLRARNRRRD